MGAYYNNCFTRDDSEEVSGMKYKKESVFEGHKMTEEKKRKDDMDIDTRTLHMSSIRQQEEGTRRRSAPDRIESTVYGWEDDDEDGISQEHKTMKRANY